MAGSSTSSATDNKSTSPYAPQAAALSNTFNAAPGALATSTANNNATTPSGFVAQMTPDQLATYQAMVGAGNNPAIPNAQGSTGTNLLNSGANATNGALSGLGSFDPTKINSTDGVLSAAKQYADNANQYIPGQVKNAMLAGTQTARDVINPGIENYASNTGNTNSSRSGIATGLVDRGLAEQASGLSSTLQGNAYTTGLGLAENQASSNNTDKLGALSALLSGANNTTSAGNTSLNSSVANLGSLFGLSSAGGAGEQAGSQANLSNQVAANQFGTQQPYSSLQAYMNLIGSQLYGSNSTDTSTKTPSFFDTLSGLLSAGGAAVGGAAKVAALPAGSGLPLTSVPNPNGGGTAYGYGA